MSGLWWLPVLALALAGSGLFSGGETGIYSLSRWRIEAEARQGVRYARIVQRLLQDDAWLLATILIGNNVANQLGAVAGKGLAVSWGVPDGLEEVAATLLAAPLFFLFGELLPKDLFRRRPHVLLSYTAPLIAFAKGLFLPLAWPLRLLGSVLERLIGVEAHQLAVVHGRAALLDLFRETVVDLRTERMARNVLGLRSRRVDRVMVPWRRVEVLPGDEPADRQAQLVRRSRFSRLPVSGASGAVRGYVHQLDVLGAGPEVPPLRHLRPIPVLAPATPLDRALGLLRAAGQRAAVVGTLERPLGLVTLKDLVEEISGELARW